MELAQTFLPAPSPTEPTKRGEGAQAIVPAQSSAEAVAGVQNGADTRASARRSRGRGGHDACAGKRAGAKPATQHRPSWLVVSRPAHERAEYDAAQGDAREWRKSRLDQPPIRKRYLAAPDATGERKADFERLRAALNFAERLRQRARGRQKRARAGGMAARGRRSWIAYLDEHERAQVYSEQDSIREWRQRSLHNTRVQQAYLAAPDPTSERHQLSSLAAAVAARPLSAGHATSLAVAMSNPCTNLRYSALRKLSLVYQDMLRQRCSRGSVKNRCACGKDSERCASKTAGTFTL